MISLKPHHVWAYINFHKKEKHKLSEQEYMNTFLAKNSGYHNKKFIIYWRAFLIALWEKPKTKFIYSFDYDEVCENCDIQKECKNKNTHLHSLVDSLDKKYHKQLGLEIWKVYSIEEINTLFL